MAQRAEESHANSSLPFPPLDNAQDISAPLRRWLFERLCSAHRFDVVFSGRSARKVTHTALGCVSLRWFITYIACTCRVGCRWSRQLLMSTRLNGCPRSPQGSVRPDHGGAPKMYNRPDGTERSPVTHFPYLSTFLIRRKLYLVGDVKQVISLFYRGGLGGGCSGGLHLCPASSSSIARRTVRTSDAKNRYYCLDKEQSIRSLRGQLIAPGSRAVMGPSECLPGSDRLLGPRADTSCRSFDFTLLFEDAFLGCLPAAVLLFLLPSHVLWLSRQRPVGGQAYSFRLFACKILSIHHSPSLDVSIKSSTVRLTDKGSEHRERPGWPG